MSDLDERVMQFKCLELPGQPMRMHMGTSYLVNDLHAEVKRLRVERDALATRVSNSNADMLTAASNIRSAVPEADIHLQGVADMLERSAGEKPTATSLARLKTEWQAEVLEDMVDMVNPDNPGRSLRDMASVLRRQAEGDDHDSD